MEILSIILLGGLMLLIASFGSWGGESLDPYYEDELKHCRFQLIDCKRMSPKLNKIYEYLRKIAKEGKRKEFDLGLQEFWKQFKRENLAVPVGLRMDGYYMDDFVDRKRDKVDTLFASASGVIAEEVKKARAEKRPVDTDLIDTVTRLDNKFRGK